MEKLKCIIKNLSIRKSFILYIIAFLLIDIILCIVPASLLQNWLKSAYEFLTPIITTIYSVLCLLGASFLFYYKKIKEPITLIQDASQKIINQDLDFSISYKKYDEMGKLCEAFEYMRKVLLENHREIWNQIEERHQVNTAFAHNMRTPLTILKGYLEIFELQSNKMTAEAIKENSAIMKRHLIRIENYINAMNSLQKMEDIRAERKTISSEFLEYELRQVVSMLCKQMKKRLDIDIQFSEEELFVDIDIILQVLENLINNAGRYAFSKIKLDIWDDKNYLILTVNDDGKGFSKQALKHGNSPFYTESDNQDNYGLGLYICSLLCKKHKGTMTISNNEIGGMVIVRFLKSLEKG